MPSKPKHGSGTGYGNHVVRKPTKSRSKIIVYEDNSKSEPIKKTPSTTAVRRRKK